MDNKLDVIRVKYLKLNQDRRTAKVVLDCMYNGMNCKITIPKLDIASIVISDECISEINSDVIHRNVVASMNMVENDNKECFIIKTNRK